MAAVTIEEVRLMNLVRRLARTFPRESIPDRLTTIRGLISGDIKPEQIRRPVDRTIQDRLAAGMASKAKRTALDKIEEQREADAAKAAAEAEEQAEFERRQKSGRDRMAKGGKDRE